MLIDFLKYLFRDRNNFANIDSKVIKYQMPDDIYLELPEKDRDWFCTLYKQFRIKELYCEKFGSCSFSELSVIEAKFEGEKDLYIVTK